MCKNAILSAALIAVIIALGPGFHAVSQQGDEYSGSLLGAVVRVSGDEVATPEGAVETPSCPNIPARFDWYRYQGEVSDENTYCGQTCVAMAIQFARNEEVDINRIIARFPNDLDGGTSTNRLLEALGDYDVARGTISTDNMQAVERAVNNGHIVLVPIKPRHIAHGEDWPEGWPPKKPANEDVDNDPNHNKNRYFDYYEHSGGHWVVVKGISDDRKWIITYDPNVFDTSKTDRRYWYSNGCAKGRDRHYDYSDFKDAFTSFGKNAQAIEVLVTPNGTGGCADRSYGGVVLFDSVDCRGSKREFSAPSSLIDLSDTEWDDRARSIYIHPGWSVKAFQHSRGRGASRCVARSLWDLSKLRFENSDTLLDAEISSIEVFYDSACGEGLKPVLYEQPEFPILQPGDRAEICFELLNAGSQTWEAGHYALVNVNDQPLGARPDGAGSKDVASGGKVRLHLSITAPVEPDIYRTEWRFSYDGNLIGSGPLLWTDVIVVPEGSDDLVASIREMIEKARQDAEDWINEKWEDLRRKILEKIEAEKERAKKKLWEWFLDYLCDGPTATMILSLAVLWLGHRRSRVANRKR